VSWPVPVSAIVAGEFVALLTTDTLPVTLPTAVGAKATFTVADWLGIKMVPDVTPLVLNPVPVTVTPEIVTFEFPLFVNVSPNELLVPTPTFPKLRFVGFAPSRKVAATPVPLKEIAKGEAGALLTRETEPVTVPAESGLKTTLKEALLPAAIVIGTVRPVMLKPAPVTFA
jgi:hypothetical protein